jgi:hypothetical protein
MLSSSAITLKDETGPQLTVPSSLGFLPDLIDDGFKASSTAADAIWKEVATPRFREATDDLRLKVS